MSWSGSGDEGIEEVEGIAANQHTDQRELVWVKGLIPMTVSW